MTAPLRGVLFDLDGTVLDTAPDFLRVLNALLAESGRAPLPLSAVRPNVSHGSRRVVKLGFPDADDAQFAALQQRFLEIYRAGLSLETRLFAGMEQVLRGLATRGLRTGIVTNKPAWLAELDLARRFDCVVSGDTVGVGKPDPAPLLHAAGLAGLTPADCIYVGDAERDVEAAHRAGMPALVANYGYIGTGDDTAAWQGDGYLESPLALLGWLDASGRA
jgi:phosphoglycolate phosphatase